jgi:enamine deaminase RidA (YjgF/YER057c/UK114 family)
MSEGKQASCSVCRAGEREALFVCRGAPGVSAKEAARSAYEQIGAALGIGGMAIFHERIFGSISGYHEVIRERRAALESSGMDARTPLTYLQGAPPWGEGMTGVIVHAVSASNPNDAVWTIRDRDTPCGRGWRIDGATYLMLQGVGSGEASNAAPALQANGAIERIERLLGENGASFHHVVRTWFYLSDILEWYDAFNKVRNEKYRAFGILPGPQNPTLMLPASTGISAQNRVGSACAVDVMAIVPSKENLPQIQQLSNPGQKDAFRYGSAFSRGALIRHPHRAMIELSGTAAIDQSGNSLYPDDIRSQIGGTFDKVEVLLEQQGATLADIGAATVFIKRPEYADLFWQMARERGLDDFPGVCVVADICRDELLFEIDAEVVFHFDGIDAGPSPAQSSPGPLRNPAR